jgi:SAM-dependent methyltransferase
MATMSNEQWDARYAASPSVWSITPNEFVVEFLSDMPAGKVIDLAGGEGRNALWLAGRGWQAEVADFSQVALEKFTARAAEEGLSEHCFATLADATTETAYALAPADLGLIAYLQIDAAGLSDAIASLTQALAPGATLFGVWHERDNLTHGFGGPQVPEMLPTEDELRTASERAGLNIQTLEKRERNFETDGIPRLGIDVVLVARKSPAGE